MTILVDSGATLNYIRTGIKIGESVSLSKGYKTKTIHGHSEIKLKKIINLLGYNLTFFEINELLEYDMILGEQGLRQMRAKLNFSEYKIYYNKQKIQHKINYTNDNLGYEKKISELMQKNKMISEKLPFTTTIQASIRTKNDEPI